MHVTLDRPFTPLLLLRTFVLHVDLENGGISSSLDGSPVLGNKAEPKQLDSKEKMTYTEQAAKRKHCQRLTRFECSTLINILLVEDQF